ncbi:proteasome subunit beta [Blastococcus sp. Marseille-P5729]|uniref:proteasome subunit beta n=1 Tax=Blastococcus sp. Marseille-P5729 TaxID=2086582 RepID=UPI000D0EDABC|nr:proteasome subunit beta [Blastococcus sp. Marseille-P5729]
MPHDTPFGGLPAPYLSEGGSSFTDFLGRAQPDLLPGRRPLPPGTIGADAPHGTTIVSATFAGGVVIGGDRRATMGNLIAQRDIEKVYAADAHSAIGIAGAAGIALDMVRLFQIELEHYEKIEGATLSLDGKANRLSAMLKGNLSIALQGLAVLPLYVGYDEDQAPERAGRIFSYDVTGGCYEEQFFHAIGSGSMFAKSSLKKLWNRDLDENGVVHALIEALYDAADDDTATGGPDLTRGLFPICMVITRDGVRRVTDAEIEQICDDVLSGRTQRLRRDRSVSSEHTPQGSGR